jgi:hypothetical protein
MDAIWTILQSQSLLTTTTVLAAICGFFLWLGKLWGEASIKSRFDKLAEDYKFELRAHEQGAKVAEYLSLSPLKDEDPEEKYQRANQLAWELFLWLPDETYRKLGRGLKGNPKEISDAMVEVRKQLLGDRAGSLGPDDIIVHGRGIGKPQH